MKTLHLSIGVILLILVSSQAIVNPAFADNIDRQVIVDGTISLTGCKVINGTIEQIADVQNTTIQSCNYHGKHFKLSADLGCPLVSVGDTRDPETGQKYSFNVICDEPTTCGLKNSWGGYYNGNVGSSDTIIGKTINGTRFLISAFYGRGICASESYNDQEKKLNLIVNGLWENDTIINLKIPKLLLENVGVMVDGQKVSPTIIDHNPDNADQGCEQCYYEIHMHLPYSLTSKKIEIGGNPIPEFPFATFVLLTSITSMIIFYRLKFRNKI